MLTRTLARSAVEFGRGLTGHTEGMEDTDGAVRGRVWRNGQVVAEDFDFARISDYLDETDSLTWVDICDPDHRILQDLASELMLDPLAVEDAIAHAERAKATRYATHTFMTVYAVKLNTAARRRAGGSLTIHKISAFVFPRGLITVRASPDFDIEDVVRRWDDNADLLKYGVGALVHGLLDMIVDGHFEAVQVLDDAMEGLEDGLFDETAPSAASPARHLPDPQRPRRAAARGPPDARGHQRRPAPP